MYGNGYVQGRRTMLGPRLLQQETRSESPSGSQPGRIRVITDPRRTRVPAYMDPSSYTHTGKARSLRLKCLYTSASTIPCVVLHHGQEQNHILSRWRQSFKQSSAENDAWRPRSQQHRPLNKIYGDCQQGAGKCVYAPKKYS